MVIKLPPGGGDYTTSWKTVLESPVSGPTVDAAVVKHQLRDQLNSTSASYAFEGHEDAAEEGG